MPTDGLEQALEESAVEGAEKDLAEVLARLFKADLALVARLLFAIKNARAEELGVPRCEDVELPNELGEAIKHAVEDGLRRARVRRSILRHEALTVQVSTLTLQPRDICKGCPESMRCVLESISTPAKCYSSRKSEMPVQPIRLRGNRVTVRAEQPTGTYEVTVRDFNLPRPYRPKKDR